MGLKRRARPRRSLADIIDELRRTWMRIYDEASSFEPMKPLLLEAIDACDDGDELLDVLREEPFDQCTFGEDSFWPEVAPAIASAAERVTPEHRARAIGLSIRCVEFLPSCIVERDRAANLNCIRKTDYAAGFDQLIDRFRAGLDSGPAERAGYAHAFAHCGSVEPADVVRMLDALSREDDDEAMASLALSIGVVGSRFRDSLARALLERVRSLRDLLGVESVLVGSCAAAGLLMFEGVADAAVTAAFTRGIAEPVQLPAAWGWGAPRRDTTEELLVPMAAWAPWTPDQAARVVVALAGSTGWQVGEVLWRLAFDNGSSVPAGGVALAELTPAQRVFIEYMASKDAEIPRESRSLGFWWTDVEVPAFLAAVEPRWRPLDVSTHAGPRRWHFCKIWRGYMLDQLSLDAALAALFDNLPRDQLLRLVVDRKHRVLLTVFAQKRPEPYQRDVVLLLAILRRLLDGVPDPVAGVTELARSFRPVGEGDALSLSFAMLIAHGRAGTVPPAKYDAMFAWGMNRAAVQSCVEQLAAMLDVLGPERVALIRSNHYL